MKLSFLTARMVLLFFLLSSSIIAADFDQPKIKMGPLLHFNGQDLENRYWEVSALYLLKRETAPHPLLKMSELDVENSVKGEVIGTKYGYDFVKYDLTIRQNHKERTITYAIPGHAPYRFVVPAIGQAHQIVAHSCNGYQRNKDREKVGGINPMWAQVNYEHRESPFHVQIGLGDQIYADGLINKGGSDTTEPHWGHTYGVFALSSLKPWIKDKERHGFAPFTEEMADEVDRFYFDHYVAHFNNEEFKMANATIPMVAQPDDHDYFDGAGSYPDYLQDSFVMAGIRRMGMWYAFTVQHQLEATAYLQTSDHDAQPYNFLHVINDGKIAIYGVDTRTQRTAHQIVPTKTWERIFSELLALPESVEHILFAIGVPVVYPSSEALDGTFKSIDATHILPDVLPHVPLLKSIFQKNAFGLFELADDLRDGWSHPAHIDERNMMVARLQEIAMKKNTRITLISGDVHLGGIGLIEKERGTWRNDTMAQIITSPIGNINVKKTTANFLARQGCSDQDVGLGSRMCLVKPIRATDHREKKHALIAHRNFVRLNLDSSGTLRTLWNAEAHDYKSAHQQYYYNIPRAHTAY